MDQVIHHSQRATGLLGAGLTLIGGFLPWADADLTGAAPAAAGLFLLSIIAAVTMFHRNGGAAGMVIGGICAVAAVFALLGNPSSAPSLGLLLSMVGGGLVAYAGYQLRQ